ncbi:MAG: hypothetical protein QW154_07735 [Sulfolobales archaeon]
MPTVWRLEVVREVRLVSLGLAALLVLVGLVALVEKGPQVPAIPIGPSPLSPLSYGTQSLYEIARSTYRTAIILKPEDISSLNSSRCLYVIVSPTIPVGVSNATELVTSLRRSCEVMAVLVADEDTTSNGLLEALNSTIRVVGNRVGVPYDGSLLYYPKATILVSGKKFVVSLDLASEVVGGKLSGYTVGVAVEASPSFKLVGAPPTHREDMLSARVVAVASEEVVDGIHVYVLGDGSILLNQVLNSGDRSYRELAEELLRYLCAGDRECTVMFDAIHYSLTNPYAVLSSGAQARDVIASFLDVLYVSTAAFLAVLHPAVWFPELLELANFYLRLVVSSPIAYGLVPLLAFYFSRLLYAGEPGVRDRPMPEQIEKDLYIAPDIRKSVLSRAVKLDSRDFVNLYSIVDLVVLTLVGVRLSDESFPRVMSSYVGTERALEYWKSMNKLYRRATGKSLWPPVVFWKRAVLRSLDESESILNSLGESLTKSLGTGYLATIGGRLGGSSQENP